MEYLLYAEILTNHSKFKTNKSKVCCWMNPSASVLQPSPYRCHQGWNKHDSEKSQYKRCLSTAQLPMGRAWKFPGIGRSETQLCPLLKNQPLARHQKSCGAAGQVGLRSPLLCPHFYHVQNGPRQVPGRSNLQSGILKEQGWINMVSATQSNLTGTGELPN